MNERFNKKMDQTAALQAGNTLVLSEHMKVRCLLIKEKRELHADVLVDEIERLNQHPITVNDDTSGLMDRIIHLKWLLRRLLEGTA